MVGDCYNRNFNVIGARKLLVYLVYPSLWFNIDCVDTAIFIDHEARDPIVYSYKLRVFDHEFELPLRCIDQVNGVSIFEYIFLYFLVHSFLLAARIRNILIFLHSKEYFHGFKHSIWYHVYETKINTCRWNNQAYWAIARSIVYYHGQCQFHLLISGDLCATGVR